LRATDSITDKIKIYTANSDYEIKPEKSLDSFEKMSVKLNTIAQTASGSLESKQLSEDFNLQMKIFKEEAPSKIELLETKDTITPISTNHSVPADMHADNLNNYLTKVEISELWRTVTELRDVDSDNDGYPDKDSNGNIVKEQVQVSRPNALKLNFMIPQNADMFGIFSIYLETPVDKLDIKSKQNMLTENSRVFIDLPAEFGSYQDIISIYNNRNYDADTGKYRDTWWSEGIPASVDADDEKTPNRLYLRAGLNCIKITKSCR
jgi:hypothetical protein